LDICVDKVRAVNKVDELRVLYVEDDTVDAMNIERMLRKVSDARIELFVSTRFSEALELLEAEPIDVILLDLSLPDSYGIDSVKSMRLHAPQQALVVLTGLSDESMALDAVKAGAEDYLVKGTFNAELIFRVISYALERQKSKQRLSHIAHYDELTKLPNRLHFKEHLALSVARAARHSLCIGVLFIDLDHFKLINDTQGHHIGDNFLQLVSRRFKQTIRSSDFMARLGGDEFTVIIDCQDKGAREPLSVAQKIIEAMTIPLMLDNGETVVAACSIGISLFRGGEDKPDPEALIQRADSAMYRAKQLGGQRFHFYDDELEAEAKQRIYLFKGLASALKKGEFCLHYQPIYQAQTQTLAGFEGLIRWKDPKVGLTMPADFIPLLEETNLINKVDEWALREGCSQYQRWLDSGDISSDVWLSLNVSPKQFVDGQIIDQVKEALDVSGMAAEKLHLEITEGLLLEHTEKNISYLHELKALGVRIVIDDFGTGFSSMQYLKMIPMDMLKIDKTFIDGYLSIPADQLITTAMINLAHNLGKTVVAEGVETKSVADALSSAGCDFHQGYYFSKPLDVADCPAAFMSEKRVVRN